MKLTGYVLGKVATFLRCASQQNNHSDPTGPLGTQYHGNFLDLPPVSDSQWFEISSVKWVRIRTHLAPLISKVWLADTGPRG